MPVSELASPTPAVIAELPNFPIKNKLIVILDAASKFVDTVGTTNRKNFNAIFSFDIVAGKLTFF